MISNAKLSPKALREMTMEAAMGHDTFPLKQLNNGHLEVIEGLIRIAMAPEAHKWLLKPLRLTWHPSHSPTLDAQLIHHSNSDEFLHVESILWKGK